MIGGLLLLAIAVFGVMVLFGKARPEQLFKFAIILIFAPVLLAVGYNHVLWFWLDLPLRTRALSLLLVPFFVSALLRLMFPKAKWLEGLQVVVFQTLIYLVTFPIRFLWRAGRFVFRRERRTARLNPHRPVVGGRPPFINDGEGRKNQNDLFD